MVAVKVWLGGEGPCELGGRADGNDRIGTLEALLLRVEPNGWTVVGATLWRKIRKFRAGAAIRDGIKHADLANVRGLVFEAHERGCDVVAFSRDRDADKGREAAIAKGIELSVFDRPIQVIGGLAKPSLEGWILALRGKRNTDDLSRQRAEEALIEQGIAVRDVEVYVEIVEGAFPKGLLDSLPVGSESLHSWLETAAAVFARTIPGA